MTADEPSQEWARVDRAADPAACVGYLDAVAGLEGVRAYKRGTFALLDVRPGHRVLDVGCGAGDDVLALAELVGPEGRVVGVDASAAMVDEAARRAEGRGLPVAFRVGDAHRLPFADGSFDAARADRTFQHLADPERALAELVRVTTPGGAVVVADTDWGMLAVDAPDQDTTRRVAEAIAERVRHPWMGRRLLGLFRRAGLTDVVVETGAAVLTDLAAADRILYLRDGVTAAREGGTVSAAAAAAWWGGLEDAAREGRFCSAIAGFLVKGRRP